MMVEEVPTLRYREADVINNNNILLIFQRIFLDV